MKILFENITEYNKSEINKFQRFHMKINKPYRIYIILFIFMIIYLYIINILNRNWEWILLVTSLCVGIFCYFKFYKKKKDVDNNTRLSNKKIKFDFYERYLTTSEIELPNKEKAITNYFEIKKIYETEENIYLYTGETYSFVLNKKNFTIGKLNDFRNFIKRKCPFKYRKKYILIEKAGTVKEKNKKRKQKNMRDN